MGLISTVQSWFLKAPPPAAAAAATAGTSGRPDYASALGGFGTLPRDQSFQLLGQFYRSIPALKRAVAVLSGFVGTPQLVGASERDTAELNQWAAQVGYGRIGRGLGTWINDLCGQSLVYGYAVGEAEIDPARREVNRLWVYHSQSCGFRSDALGALAIVQQQRSAAGLRTLNPETTTLVVHDPTGCNPQGESLFMAIPTVAQLWLDVLHNYRQTWRRSGTPRFHVNWETPANWNDPEGKKAAAILAGVERMFNEGMRSAVVDGKAKDFFSAGTIKVTTIGADGQVLDVQVAKRNVVEEIVVATGLPPWMLGYSWSTTERLSTQQADMLLAYVSCLRWEQEAAIRAALDLRLRLQARRIPYELVWPDINLQDRREQAFAAHFEALAAGNRQRRHRQLWADGVWSQEQYAEAETDSEEIATPFDAPQPLAQATTGEAAGGAGGSADGGTGANDAGDAGRALDAFALREARDEYAGLFAGCNGRH